MPLHFSCTISPRAVTQDLLPLALAAFCIGQDYVSPTILTVIVCCVICWNGCPIGHLVHLVDICNGR
jgi:hypothetical protein